MAESDKIKASDIIQKDLFDNTIKSAEKLTTTLDTLEKELIDIAEAQAKIAKNSSKEFKNADDIQKVNSALNESAKARKRANTIQKEKIKLDERLKILNSTAIDQNTALKVQIQAQTKTNKELTRIKLGLVGAYEKESKQLIKLRKEYKDVATSEGVASKEAQRLNKEVTKLDQKLKLVDKSAGQFQRNVGNYPKNFNKATAASVNFGKSLIGAFGVVAGVQLFARAIGDTFQRIRDFDKELTTLSSILGKNREEISGLEKVIIDVAGASVKTSNEVARLATTLVTLGKTEADIVQLLKPVNDLSIGLSASSEEAGELLIQTLNAFGEGSGSAQKFADIKAKVRTSTALDFQRIKDALGFLAPTANAVGLSLERTSALLGVLVDNGIKASRAGRLLNSSFARLVKEGLTLEGALDRVNRSTDKVKTATELFGTESFSLALILADNRDKVDELTASFEDSKGSLEELTNKQLKSLDARLKILDSTWEKFILSVEKGDGVLARVARGSISFLIKALEQLTVIGSIAEVIFKGVDDASLSAVKAVIQLQNATLDSGKLFSDFIKQFDDVSVDTLFGDVDKLIEFRLEFIKLAEAEGETREDAERLFEAYFSLRKEEFDLTQQTKDLTDATDDNGDAIDGNDKKVKKLTKSYKDLFKTIKIDGGSFKEIADDIDRALFGIQDIDTDDFGIDEELAEENIKTVGEIYKEGLSEIERAGLENGDSQEAILEKQLALTEEYLEKELEFRKQYGDDTTDLEIELARTRNQIAQNELEDSRDIQDAKIDSLKNLNNAAQLLAGENEEAQKALLAVQKSIAVSEILVNLQRETSDIRARNADKENADQLNSSQITQARTSALLGVATVLATQSAYDGVENTGAGGNGDDRGGMLWMLHPEERVMTRKQNIKTGGMSNDDLADMAMMYNTGQLINPMTDLALSVNNKKDKHTDKTYLIVNGLNELKQTIINEPKQQVNVDSFGNLIEVSYRKGVKNTTTYKGKDWI